ncbi:eCIS core domain-containing protein [Chitinophaga vietnamensis]|uniref:eCIS core domain-containing protein n=1 Tax=Chitinophaga vietnamensis TaxID=2593957 RepID=UPI0011787070|nr:DUF4157 domain-containing protein [Chitinophaga vietnamensis]
MKQNTPKSAPEAESRPAAHHAAITAPYARSGLLLIMPKLRVGAVDDPMEREADTMADKVLRSPAPFSIQRKCAHCEEEEKKVQLKPQSSFAQSQSNDSAIAESLHHSAGQGQGMDAPVRSFMEERFGANFSAVRIHTGHEAGQLSEQLQARAFTVGNDIYFNSGEYRPDSDSGKHLLAHELTHTIQQNGAAALIQRAPKCPQDVIDKLVEEMHKYYDKERSCNSYDTCESATAKVAAGYGAVDARTVLQQKCFSPGDPKYEEHMEEIAKASKALRNCIAIMTEKCGPSLLEFSALVLAAAAARKLGGDAAKQLVTKLVGGAAGKAFAYATAAALIILLISGKAEAKISLDGDDPLVALYKAMEQDGVDVPKELRDYIDSNPELKQSLIDAAKKGNLSDAKKELAKKYMDYLNQHMDEFTPEELQALLSTTDAVGVNAKQDINVEDLKKALKQQADKKGGAAKGDKPGKGDPATKGDNKDKKEKGKDETKAPQQGTPNTGGLPGDKPADKPAEQPADKQFAKLNDDSKQKIKSAPAPVAALLKAFASGITGGVSLDDNAVSKFFSIVPLNLTKEQADALINQLTAAVDKTLDQLMDALKKGIDDLQKKDAASGDAAAGDSSTAQPSATGKTKEELVAELKDLAAKTDFSKIPAKKYQIMHIGKKVSGQTISTYVLGNMDGTGIAGIMSGKLPAGVDISKLKTGDSVVVTITSVSVFVDKDGKEYAITLGNTITIKR